MKKELTQRQEQAIAKLDGIIYYYAQIETEDHTPLIDQIIHNIEFIQEADEGSPEATDLYLNQMYNACNSLNRAKKSLWMLVVSLPWS